MCREYKDIYLVLLDESLFYDGRQWREIDDPEVGEVYFHKEFHEFFYRYTIIKWSSNE